MNTNKNYYAILQIHEFAEPEVVEAAYKRLAKKYHPDVNKDPNTKSYMQELNEAYEILSNPFKREEYDQSQKSDITFSPVSLDFGTLEQNKSTSLSFQIFNSGGPANSVHIDWNIEPSWATIEILPHPSDVFPITVTITVNTNSITPDNYSSTIEIVVDEQVHYIPISLVVKPRVTPKPIAAIPIIPTTTTKTTFTLGFLKNKRFWNSLILFLLSTLLWYSFPFGWFLAIFLLATGRFHPIKAMLSLFLSSMFLILFYSVGLTIQYLLNPR